MDTPPNNDHDLLISMKENLKSIIEELRLLRDNTNDRLKNVEQNKLDKVDFVDFKITTNKTLDEKVDVKDFAPFKKTLVNINWILIATVVVALLALITLHGGGNHAVTNVIGN